MLVSLRTDTSASPVKRDTFRKRAIEQAAKELRVGSAHVIRVITTAVTVDLLADGRELGDLGIAALTHFRGFIERRMVPDERWAIKSGFEKLAREMFRQAVAESWSQEATRKKVAEAIKGQPGKRPRSKPQLHDKHPVDAPNEEAKNRQREKAAASKAAPRDVAEMCLELIEAAEEPLAVAACLQTLLAELVSRKQRERRLWAG